MAGPGPSSAYYANFASTSNGPIRPPSPPSSPLLTPRHPASDSIESQQSESLYAILNVERSASETEIREKYRSLATTFHPDRQRDEASKAAAHGRFQEIHRAYEILMDHQKRTIYDLFGEEGLRTSWDIGPRNRTPEELRRHFQKQHYEKIQHDAESLVKPRGDMNLVFDARAVFLPRNAFANPEQYRHDPIARVQRIRPGRITMKHSFETPIAEKTQLVCSGQMSARNGAGGANVIGTVKHQFSPRLWGEVGTSLFYPRVLTGKATYTHDENTFVTVNAVQQTFAAPPRISISLGRRLYAQTTGFLTYKSGFFSLGPWGKNLDPRLAISDKSALSLGLTTTKHNGTGWTLETQAGLIDSHVTSDWSTRILDLKVKIGAETGTTSGISGFVDAEGKVTEYIRTGMTVSVEWAGGISMRLRFSRLGQKITIPVLLSHNLNPYVLFGATMIPAASYVALHRYYILPRKKQRIAERVKELREQHADYIAQKKTEAQEAISIMERPTAAKIAQERERHGLIIISAQYGLASAFTERGIKSHSASGDEIIDVTIPVQALVSDSKLVIPGGRAKFNLLGFWDPCIGENKKLRVRYLFRDTLHEITVDDVAALRAPLKAHALDT